jgi:hypothetical protein
MVKIEAPAISAMTDFQAPAEVQGHCPEKTLEVP